MPLHLNLHFSLPFNLNHLVTLKVFLYYHVKLFLYPLLFIKRLSIDQLILDFNIIKIIIQFIKHDVSHQKKDLEDYREAYIIRLIKKLFFLDNPIIISKPKDKK